MGAKLSKHAKERLKERYGIVSTVDFMKNLHNKSKQVSESRNCKIMSFDFQGKTIQYVLVEQFQQVQVVKTFIPDTFGESYENYIDKYKLYDDKEIIKEKDKSIKSLSKMIKGLEKQIANERLERKKFFNKSFIKAFIYFYKNRYRYLNGNKIKCNKIKSNQYRKK